MQRWEYKVVIRGRTWKDRMKDSPLLVPTDWITYVDDQQIYIDVENLINQLGDRGWELVSIVAVSDALGGAGYISGGVAFGGGRVNGTTSDYAGFTTKEKWVFKRPRE